MRRLRLPTIPDMGMPSSHKGGESLQASDSAIFADAEEETPLPEKRPSAPHMSGLRRRRHPDEEERYEDANHNESPRRKHPSATTKLETLATLASPQEASASEEREDTYHEDKNGMQLQNQEERIEAVSGIEQKNISVSRNETSPSPTVKGHSCMSFKSDKAIEVLSSPPGQIDSSSLFCRESSNDINTRRARTQVLRNQLEKSRQKAVEIARRLQHQLLREAIPELQQKAQIGLAFVKTNILAVFFFLKWMLLTFSKCLNEIEIRQAQHVDRGDAVCSSAEPSEENATDIEIKETAQSTLESQNDGENTGSNCSKAVSEKQIQPNSAVGDKILTIPSSNTAEETMTAVPWLPSVDQAMNYTFKDQKGAKEHAYCNTNVAQNATGGSGSVIGANSPNFNEFSFNTRLAAKGSSSEPSTGTLSNSRNSGEDLLSEFDQGSMHFEHRDAEIILSPLDSTTPTFASDGEFGADDLHRGNYPRARSRIAERPRRRSIEMNLRTRLPGTKRTTRGPTGKLKSEVRTMKGSLFRVFGRNKIEPETRFASPRSARKTLALVADMLVKEYGCDVAVRRNGALKMRCEKAFSGGLKLRVRLAFQPMDAFSCNVSVCRSREDDLQVSTTDYVAFVADLQRSFLNAFSDGLHGTPSG